MSLLLIAARLPIPTPDTAHRRKALDVAIDESISSWRRGASAAPTLIGIPVADAPKLRSP